MKLLLISVVLLLLRLQFGSMEPNPDGTSLDMPSDDWDSEAYESSCDATKPIKLPSCSQIAKAAAEIAQAASDAQADAAQNASLQVKLMLANRAQAAAYAVNFLVKGKQAVVDKLAKQIQEEEAVVARLKASLGTSQSNVEATSSASKIGDDLKNTMQGVADQMKSSLEDLNGLVDQYQADLDEKNQNLGKAKELGERLSKEVAEAKAEYEMLKLATDRAVAAALEAEQKNPSPSNVTAPPGN